MTTLFVIETALDWSQENSQEQASHDQTHDRLYIQVPIGKTFRSLSGWSIRDLNVCGINLTALTYQ